MDKRNRHPIRLGGVIFGLHNDWRDVLIAMGFFPADWLTANPRSAN